MRAVAKPRQFRVTGGLALIACSFLIASAGCAGTRPSPRSSAQTPSRATTPSPASISRVSIDDLPDDLAISAAGDLWLLSPRSGEAEQLTEGAEEDFSPAWLPDGDSLAFRREAGGAPSRIFRVSVATDAVSPFRAFPQDAEGITYAPGGSVAIYSGGLPGDRDSNGDILVVRPDGSDPKLLAGWPTETDEFPAWSPDGSMVTFASTRGVGQGGERALWSVAADGSHPRLLSEDGRFSSWSPDGLTIVYEKRGRDVPELWMMSPDGSDQRRLATGEMPAWSPDGSVIAFVSPQGLALIAPDGTGEEVLDWGLGGSAVFPEWRPT